MTSNAHLPLSDRLRNAWLNRCLLCLIWPFHGKAAADDES